VNATDPEPRFEIRNRKGAQPPVPPEDPPVDEPQDEVVQEETDSAPPEETPKVAAEPRPGRSGLWVWGVCAVAIVAVVLAFFSWRSADNDPDRARADLRDTAVIQGTEAVETMNSIDYRDVASGVEAWQDVSTGVLHDQLVAMTPEDQQLLADQKKIATGRVVQAALSDLTDRTATLLVAVEVTVRGEDVTVQPTVKRNRFAADLVLVKGTWKLENLAQVAVGT
jgi:Mce-associated membrane protein